MSKYFELKNKTALISGAAGQLGVHFCEEFARAGAKVIATDINSEALEVLALACKEKNLLVETYECDIRKKQNVVDLVKIIEEEHETLHILLNAAATKGNSYEKFFQSCEDFDDDTWREIMSVNLDGAFYVAQAVGGLMMRKKVGGSIVNVSSIYGVLGPDERIYEGSQYLGHTINTPPVYAASKGGLQALTTYLSCIWAKHSIRVNTLTLGGVEHEQNDIFKKKYGARVPLGRMAKPKEVASAALFLASDASSYITGHNLMVDGGLSAW